MQKVDRIPPAKGNTDTGFFGHPRGLGVLCATGLWEVFSIFGNRTMLVYYLSKQLRYTDAAAVNIFALSNAATVILSVLGAAIADRIYGPRRAVIVGGLLMASAQFALMSEPLLFSALFLLSAGDGLMKPSLCGQIGLLYSPEDPRRERGYTLFKVACNAGGLMAPIVFGVVAAIWDYRTSFAVGGIGMLLSIGTYWAGQRLVPADPVRTRSLAAQTAAGFIPRRALILLVIAWFGSAFFWAAYNQLGGTVALWIDRAVDRTLEVGDSTFIIPSAWFQSINPLLVLALAPIVTRLWRRHDVRASAALDVRKMALGTLFLATSFALLAVADFAGDTGHIPWVWLLIAIAPFTLGELYVEPPGQALFTRLAPRQLASTFIAIFMLSHVLGHLGSGWLGAAFERMTGTGYFALVSATALVGAAVFLLARAAYRDDADADTAKARPIDAQ